VSQPNHKKQRDPSIAPSAEELAAVEAGFSELYRGLTEAKQLFETGHTSGRKGAIHALESVLKFLEKSAVVRSHALHTPLARLFDDLMSLDDGKASGILTPSARPRGGRSRASGFYDGLKALAVFTVRRLKATGMAPIEARKIVASELTKLRARPTRKGSAGGTGQITERTLRGWQEEIAADVGCRSTAAQTLRDKEAAYLQEVITGMGLSTLHRHLTNCCCRASRSPIFGAPISTSWPPTLQVRAAVKPPKPPS
jgi:hypothetical protein